MAIDFLCGAGCEIVAPATGAPSDALHWTSASGTPSILTNSTDWPGGKAYRCAASGSAVTMVRTKQAIGRIGTGRFRISTLPAAERVFLRVTTATGTLDFSVTAGGVLKAGVTGGTFQTGPTVTNTQVFKLDWNIVTNATTWTIDWQVDGVAQTQATRGSMTSGNTTVITFGAVEASTYTVDFTDVVEAIGTGWYPLADGYVKAYYPTGDGTHNVGSGAFRDSGGNAITGATTNAYTFIDDGAPIGQGTDYLEQQTLDAAAYLEFTLATRSETHAPMAVAVTGSVAEASAAGAHCAVGLTFGSLERQSVDILGGGGTTNQDFSVVFQAVVGTSADTDVPWYGTYSWSQACVRWGYSADATPDVRLHGLCVEAWYPKTTVNISVVACGPHDMADGTRTSVTLTMPSGILTNDVEYAWVTKDGVEAITAPGTFTLIGSRQDSGTTASGSLYRRIAPDNSEAGDTHTWSWATPVVGGVFLIVVRGANTSTPEITTAQQANASAGFITLPALTASAQSMLLIGFGGLGRGATTTTNPPSGWVLADSAGDNLSTASGAFGIITYRHNTAANPPSVASTVANASVSVAFQIAVGVTSTATPRFYAFIVG